MVLVLVLVLILLILLLRPSTSKRRKVDRRDVPQPLPSRRSRASAGVIPPLILPGVVVGRYTWAHLGHVAGRERRRRAFHPRVCVGGAWAEGGEVVCVQLDTRICMSFRGCA